MPPRDDFTKFPKLADVGRWHINNFVQRVSAEIPAGSSVLDAGAGECAYKKYFTHCDYKAVDLAVGNENWAYEHLDYVSALDKLPIPDATFDAVLCTQTLEHLEYPRECVAELSRVLKPGGKLYLTAPMSHPEHQMPYDFFRYTSFGLKSVVSKAGFQTIELLPFGGIFTRWAYELPRALDVFPPVHVNGGSLSARGLLFSPLKLVSKIAVRAAQSCLLLAEPLDKKKDDPFGWYLIATKPAARS